MARRIWFGGLVLALVGLMATPAWAHVSASPAADGTEPESPAPTLTLIEGADDPGTTETTTPASDAADDVDESGDDTRAKTLQSSADLDSSRHSPRGGRAGRSGT
jgi:hypothetical protein